MSSQKQNEADGRSEEAKNLAKEAQEAVAGGEKEEGEFLAEAAKDLDPAAAAEVLGKNGKRTGGK
jgi:hypothetical protein